MSTIVCCVYKNRKKKEKQEKKECTYTRHKYILVQTLTTFNLNLLKKKNLDALPQIFHWTKLNQLKIKVKTSRQVHIWLHLFLRNRGKCYIFIEVQIFDKKNKVLSFFFYSRIYCNWPAILILKYYY